MTIYDDDMDEDNKRKEITIINLEDEGMFIKAQNCAFMSITFYYKT
jgi:hypothetical protein